MQHCLSGFGLRPVALIWIAIATLAFLFAIPAAAQSFPALSGRVVDAAEILSAETEARLTAQLAALETQSQRQLVVATVPDLQGYEIADYGYRLGRQWGIGDKGRNDGVLLLIAPNDRQMRIEVGYGLEAVLTDALSSAIIRDTITPHFRDGNFDAGVTAGVDAIQTQLTLPPEEAERVAGEAAVAEVSDGTVGMIIFWVFVAIFIALIIIGNRGGGKRTKGRHGPVIVWGGSGSDWGGGSSWSSGGGGFGGGFSGGGGSFGGGGASGGW